MRLLILTPEFEGAAGGLAAFYRYLLPALRDFGVDTRVIEGSATYAGERRPRTVHGVAVETLEGDRLLRWRQKFPAYAATPSLRRHLAAAWAVWEQAGFGVDADIIEAADWGLLFVPPAIEGRTPLVVQGHGSVGQISVHDPLEGEEVQGALVRMIESAILARCAVFQTYSHANADFWSQQIGGDVTMIRPSVPLAPVAAADAPSSRGLVVGRIQRWKGPLVVCKALELLGDRAPGLDWFGRDTSFGRRETSTAGELAREFPAIWGKRVAPHSPISPAEVARRQASALFNLVPSTWDVFNFTAAEAMASGRPAIVSTGAGASELIADGENGFLFSADDAGSLAAAVERVLVAPATRLTEVGVAARETVRRELDPVAIAQARAAAYRTVIEAHRAAAVQPIGGWLGEVCRPGAGGSTDGAFLGQFPARAIATHLAGRVRDKVGAAFSKGASRG